MCFLNVSCSTYALYNINEPWKGKGARYSHTLSLARKNISRAWVVKFGKLGRYNGWLAILHNEYFILQFLHTNLNTSFIIYCILGLSSMQEKGTVNIRPHTTVAVSFAAQLAAQFAVSFTVSKRQQVCLLYESNVKDKKRIKNMQLTFDSSCKRAKGMRSSKEMRQFAETSKVRRLQ